MMFSRNLVSAMFRLPSYSRLCPMLQLCCCSSLHNRELTYKTPAFLQRPLYRSDAFKIEWMFRSTPYSTLCKCQKKESRLKLQTMFKVQTSTCTDSAPPKPERIPKEEILRFYTDCLVSAGACKENAAQMADVLFAADNRGHVSHGINRIAMYVDELLAGSLDGNAKPSILKQCTTTAWVDGKNAFGGVVGKFCMDLAISKATTKGISLVVAKASNHYGIGSYYTWMAMEKGLMGLSFSNSSPLVVPTGAKEAALGSNPLSLAAAGDGCDVFVMDMATANVAVGKIEVNMKKGAPIPKGWALDEKGEITTDASAAFKANRLMPLGGMDTGHKGYSLGLMVELFCGMLGDSMYGPYIRKWMTTDKCASLGHAFLCINPECFAPGFQKRLSCFMKYLHNMEPADPQRPVKVPGDLEVANMLKNEECNGICYDPSQMKNMTELANKLKVKPMGKC